MSNMGITKHLEQKYNKDLEKLNKRINEILGTEQIEHIDSENKIIGVRFNLNQKEKNSDHTILSLLELLNLYIVPAFVLPSNWKNKDISVKIGNHQETFIVKTYIKHDNTYIESKQLEQQNSNGNPLKKVWLQAKSLAQDFTHGKEEIELIEINKDKLNFQISSNESTKVEITFAGSEINIQYIESILNCASNFRELINNNAIRSLIEIDYNYPIIESQDKLNIYPFFAKRTVRYLPGDDVKNQETVLCLTTKQNDTELVSGIFGNNASQLKIKCKENEYSLLSYNLDHFFLPNLVDFLLFFNNPLYNGEAQISNLQRIEKIFSEDVKIKGTCKNKEENKIKIENATCFTSSLHHKGGYLQLKKSDTREKIYFNFEVRIENDSDQIKKESKYIYDSMIYKVVSLISFFALCLKENKFSISAEIDGKNIFFIKTNSYSGLVPAICEKLKKYSVSLMKSEDYANLKLQHVQVLDLLRTKKVSFKLEAEVQKIAINRLENIKHLMSGISVLESCREEFLDNIGNQSVHCYLSNFLHTNNNLSCVYVITHQEGLNINGQLLDKNTGIDFLKNEFQESFDRISSNFKQIENKDKFSAHSIDININKLLSQHTDRSQEEEIIKVTEALEITGEEVKAEPEKYIEYDVDWQKECFAKIAPANDYTSLELGLKEAHKFVHYRILHVCKQLLEKINTLQRGKEQKVEQDDQLSIDEPTTKAALDKNISNFYKFIEKKCIEFKAINSNFDSEQNMANIGKSILDAVQSYEKVIKIYLFINKNVNDLLELLEKNIEELEWLMSDIRINKTDQLVAESDKPAKASSATTHSTEESLSCQDIELSNTKNTDALENNSLSQASSYRQTSYTEENGEAKDQNVITNTEENSYSESQVGSDEEQENRTTPKYISTLFSKLSKKLDEWESQNQTADNDQKVNIPDLFHNLTSKVTYHIKQKAGNANVEQTRILEQYKQMLNFIENIFYSAKILYYYKIQDGFERLETEIRAIEGTAHSYLLDEKEKELKRREAQLEQEISIRKIGNDIIVSIVKGVISFSKKAKDKIINFKDQSQPQNDNTYLVNTFKNESYPKNPPHESYYTNNYGYQQLTYQYMSQSNNSTIHSTYNHKCKLSNFQKLKVGIKDTFSEKESYVFLIFSILGIAGVLAYFIPEGLRKFVPNEKLNTVDITVAIGATILTIIILTALAYSAYANIVHSNMIDPTVSSHNIQSQPIIWSGTNT